jgi:hypothetical protein
VVSAPDVPAGVWRHWKGRDYLVLSPGHDADELVRTVVVYVPLSEVAGPQLAVRSLAGFLEDVAPGVPRFRYRGSG